MDSMAAHQLPCLDLLEGTPQMLAWLISDVSPGDTRWKASSERFSMAEVLAHLSHAESNCYRRRLDRFLAEERPELEPDDAQMSLELYRSADAADSLEQFKKQRQANVEFLRGLAPEVGERVAMHKEAGSITLGHMVHEWALHDLGHVRQIAELVRARKYLAGAGPLGMYYRLAP
jgi:hypothetical protein